ncbi:MAG: efflux RND transporter permease subunit [Myxococcota bacterium]|nr:efflux RND transporter permease subunit [Myxococcota bacterium]
MNASGPIAWMARNPVASNLLMIIILVAGLLGVSRIKQEVFPEFELDMVIVTVAYPGASPEEVEQGVVLAIEQAVRGIDGVKRVGGSSNENAGSVWAELLVDADRDQAISDIKAAVDQIQSFPVEAEEPMVKVFKQPRKVMSVIVSGETELHTLHAIADKLQGQMIAANGITKVEIEGVPPREMSIEVPRETLEGLGMTLDQIAMRVRTASLDLPGGEVETRGGEILVRVADRRRSAEEYADIIVGQSNRGGLLRLGDIGTVVDGYADNDQRTLYNGKPAVQLSVFQVGAETPSGVAEVARDIAGTMATQLPDGFGIHYWNDQSELLDGRIDLLVRNGRLGLILVVGILALFLNARLAFWVSLGIPISFMGSFLLMPGLDMTINMISLFSLIVTLGMVVDDAIVVGEAAYARMEQGMERFEAAVTGARQMAVPVTFAILTTMAAFGPMFFVPGFMGKLFRIMPAIICSVLLFSLIESFFVLPAHLAHIKTENFGKGLFGKVELFLEGPRSFMSGKLMTFINGPYSVALSAVVRNRYTALATAIATLLFAIGLVAGQYLPTSFMPNIEGELVSASARLPYGSPTENTEQVREMLEESLEKTIAELGPDTVRGVYTTVGSPPVVEGPGPAVFSTGSHLLGIQVYLVQTDQRDYGANEFTATWARNTPEIPGLEALSFTDAWGPNAGAAVDLRMSHPDSAVLEQASTDMMARLRGYGDLKEFESSLADGKPRLDFQLTENARALGLTSQSIGAQIRSAFYGAEAMREQVGRDEVKVMVRLPEDQRGSEYDLHAFTVRTPTGASVTLGDVASFERNRSPTTINREDGKRTVNVKAKLAPHATSSQAVTEAVNAKDIPELIETYPGLEIGYSGEQREQAESFASLGKNYLIALIVIYGLLAIPFRSYLQPLIIMSAIPFGVVGAFLGHLLMGFNLNVISMFGIIALSGVVVNDSLVLVDGANRAHREGMSALEAIQLAGKRRFRPILLTSLTTFFGLAPMIFETSMQARFLIPMAISLGFGVLFATFIILLLVPAVFMIVDDVQRFFQSEPDDEPTPQPIPAK